MREASKEASKEDAAARDPPRVNSGLIRVYINGQELLAFLDTGYDYSHG